ncbi:Transcription factor fungi [Macrophomina phaseolina MS6]|uniref:Transcription factor fungi n=1 Tax=Macrophomina phaseolina (strain MS6) TaxID=1126212 RepID=K2SLE3_MACPH|nr:Transcription factor fungi [Macrophomina phaseolina MS6]
MCRKKQKCGLEKPECARCRNCDLKCFYPTLRRKPGPPKGAPSQRTAALHARIDQLESLLRAHAINPGSGSPSMETDTPDNPGASALSWPDFDPPSAPDAESTSSPASTYDMQVDEARTRQLLEVYFSTVQLMFPLFQRREFFQDLNNNLLHPDLILVMLSLASCVHAEPPDPALLNAVNVIERSIEKKETDYKTTLLSDIKIICLCIIHQFAMGPNRYTWMLVGKLARIAYGCKLHQVDRTPQATAHPCFPNVSLEELRYVWWTIIKIDQFSNVLTGTPCAIDTDVATTSLPCTSISDFTAGVDPDPRLIYIPRTTGPTLWNLIQDPNSALVADGQRLTLIMCLLLRDLGRDQNMISSSPPDVALKLIADTQARAIQICETLPNWYLDPQLASHYYETTLRHRLRIDALLILRTCCIYTSANLLLHLHDNLPTSPETEARLSQLWSGCVSHILAAVDLFRVMPPSYCSFSEPLMSCAGWILGCMLTICIMHRQPGMQDHAPDLALQMETGYEALLNILGECARMWPLSRKLHDSLQNIKAWHSLSLTGSEAFELFKRLLVPFPIHDAAEPDTIYEFDVISCYKPTTESSAEPDMPQWLFM